MLFSVPSLACYAILYVVTSISITTCRQKEDLDIWSNGSSSHATAPEYDRGPGRPRIIQRSTMNKDLLKIKLIWDRKQRWRLAGRNDVGVYFNNLGVLVACRLCGMNQRHIILLYDVTDFHALQLVLTYTNRIFLFFDRFHSPQSSPPIVLHGAVFVMQTELLIPITFSVTTVFRLRHFDCITVNGWVPLAEH